MTNKQNFTPEEWTKILESTMLAGMAVTAAPTKWFVGVDERRLCQQLGSSSSEV